LVGRGEVRWLELEEEGRRPVVVLTRDAALPGLRNVVVALITRSIRGTEQRPRRVDLTTSEPVENRTPSDTRFGFVERTDQILDLRATG